MYLKVKTEGRDGVWLIEKEDIINFINQYKEETIHNFLGGGGKMLIGADWAKDSVIEKINQAERIAILTGSPLKNNCRHSLAVIVENKLYMFDIGEITEKDLMIYKQE